MAKAVTEALSDFYRDWGGELNSGYQSWLASAFSYSAILLFFLITIIAVGNYIGGVFYKMCINFGLSAVPNKVTTRKITVIYRKQPTPSISLLIYPRERDRSKVPQAFRKLYENGMHHPDSWFYIMSSSLCILNIGAIISFEFVFKCVNIFSLPGFLTMFPLAKPGLQRPLAQNYYFFRMSVSLQLQYSNLLPGYTSYILPLLNNKIGLMVESSEDEM